ncbi:MAG TPA: hypothetical protein DHW07_03085 [Gammaproteobacteria bacterium]|nr:hypothetical protein [Gammaproteobacteria bacterium]
MRTRFPADDAINAALADEITRLDAERSDQTADDLDRKLLTSENSALSWSRQCTNHAVMRYIEHCGIDCQVD